MHDLDHPILVGVESTDMFLHRDSNNLHQELVFDPWCEDGGKEV
jgi:hypothetical protein